MSLKWIPVKQDTLKIIIVIVEEIVEPNHELKYQEKQTVTKDD